MKKIFIILIILCSFGLIKPMAKQTEESVRLEFCDGACLPIQSSPGYSLTTSYFSCPNFQHIRAIKDDNAILGIIEFHESKLSTSNTKCRIALLIVAKKYRKKEIGSKLFKAAIKHMVTDGCETIEWDSVDSAIPFYKKMGVPDEAFTGNHVKYQVPQKLLKKKSSQQSIFEQLQQKLSVWSDGEQGL